MKTKDELNRELVLTKNFNELLKQNKKIGITGLSHKVIHNLLQRVEDMAKEKQFNFEGV